MSGDPNDIIEIGKHVGTGVGGAGVVGVLMKWLWGREQTETAVRLKVIEEKLEALLKAQSKADELSERVAVLESKLDAINKRLDGRRTR